MTRAAYGQVGAALVALVLLGCERTATERPQANAEAVVSTERAPAERPVVRLASGEWQPYLSPGLRHGGVAAHIVSEAFAAQGIAVEYEGFPWGRALELARGGEIDGTLVWFSTPEREAQFHVSRPVIDVRFCLFHRAGEPFEWSTMEDLRGKTIGLLPPTRLSPAFERALAAGVFRVERAPHLVLNFRKLLAGRLDALVTDVEVGLDLLGREFRPEEVARVAFHPRPIRARSMHVLLSRAVPANAARVAALDRGLAALRASGTIERYLRAAREGAYRQR